MSTVRVRTRSDGSTYSQIRFRHEGKQTSESFESHADALRWQKTLDSVGPDKFRQLLAEQLGVAHDTVPLLSIAAESYIAGITGIEEGTRKRYRRFVVNDLMNHFGDIPASSLTDKLVGGWVNWLELERGNAPKTIANKHGFLFAFAAYLVKAGHIPTNPCAETQLPAITPAEMTFLEAEEFAELHSALPEKWRLMIKFMVASGCRWGETTALRVGDVDRARSSVHVQRAWKYTGGERALGKPKTKRSNRHLNLAPDLIAELPLKGRKREEFLFVRENGAPIQITTFYKGVWVPTLAALAADARDPLNGKRPRIHDLRHTCASWMLCAGTPPHVVQRHLGHESITTTVDRYGHFDQRSATAAAAVMASMLPGGKPTGLASVA